MESMSSSDMSLYATCWVDNIGGMLHVLHVSFPEAPVWLLCETESWTRWIPGRIQEGSCVLMENGMLGRLFVCLSQKDNKTYIKYYIKLPRTFIVMRQNGTSCVCLLYFFRSTIKN